MVYLGANKIKNNFSVNPVESKITVFLLDIFEAEAAYSLRRLRRTHTDCITIRRDSVGQEELTIGFDNLGNLDEAAIATFCGVDDGYLVVWHEPCNEKNATQTISTNQPKIYDGLTGTVIKDDSLPAINIDTSDVLPLPGNMSSSTSRSVVFVAKSISSNDNGPVVRYPVITFNNHVGFNNNGRIRVRWFNPDIFPTFNTPLLSPKAIAFVSSDGVNGTNLRINGIDQAIITENPTNTAPISLFGNHASQQFKGFAKEILIFNTNKHEHRASIEANINNYWNIF